MTPQQVIKHYDGSISFAAYNLDYSEAAIRYWIKNSEVPIKAQQMIEALTGGKLKADKKVQK